MSENFLDDLEKKMTRLWWEEMQSVSDVFYLTVFDKDRVIAGNGKSTKIELTLTDDGIANTERVELRARHDGVIDGMAIVSVVKREITILAVLQATEPATKREVKAGHIITLGKGSLCIRNILPQL